MVKRKAEVSTRSARPKFRPDGGFYRVLRQRVFALVDTDSHQQDEQSVVKSFVMIFWLAASYVILLATSAQRVQLLAAISMGLAAAAVGFNLFHDASHGAFAKNKKLNDIFAVFTCAILGPSRFMWHQKHHVFHHRFTNLHEWDDDIETRGFLRLSPDQPFRPWHRIQVVIWPLAYAISTIEWFFIKDFKQYFTGQVNSYLLLPKMSVAQHIEFWMTKILYVFLFGFVPIYVLGFWPALVALVLFHFTFGLVLTAVFQLAHMNDKVEYPKVTPNLSVEDEWAAHQLRTTINFAPNSAMLRWYLGGMNYQIEHHLFSGLHHRYYAVIAATVRETAIEFGLPYKVYPSWAAAFVGHMRNMNRLASPSGERSFWAAWLSG